MRSSVPATNVHSKSISVATNHARSAGHHKPLTGGRPIRRPARAPQAAGHAAGSAHGRARRSGRRRGSAGAGRRPSRCTRRRRRHRASWLPLGGARPTRVRSPRRVARPPGGPRTPRPPDLLEVRVSRPAPAGCGSPRSQRPHVSEQAGLPARRAPATDAAPARPREGCPARTTSRSAPSRPRRRARSRTSQRCSRPLLAQDDGPMPPAQDAREAP